MIVTPTMIFIHLHKTGGQFINRLLLKYISDTRRIGYHLPRSETPLELRTLPALGFVRNPWDWYVSWYAFNHVTPERNAIFRVVSAHDTLDFNQTITNLVMLGDTEHHAMRTLIAEQLPENREDNFGSGITKDLMVGMHEPKRGYLTWIWQYMFQVDGTLTGITVGRYETLRLELADTLGQLGVSIPTAMLRDIATGPAINPSSHENYHNYYSNALKQLIAVRDSEYIEHYRYRF